jgi:hypothetical protein
MASDDIKKIVREQMPGFEAVSRPDRTSRRAATPDQRSRPAAEWKAKLENEGAAGGPADAATTRRRGAPGGVRPDARRTDAPAPASRDAFFGTGDPRERLRSRAATRYRSDSGAGDDGRTVIVQVRPTDPPTDSAQPATPKAVVIKGKKIVGTQG